MKIDEIKARLDADTVVSILESLGYRVNARRMFKLRPEERTPSASVSPQGYIKDFGGDFGGDVIDLLQEIHGMNLKDALSYVGGFVGIDAPAPRPPKREPQRRGYDIEELYHRYRRGMKQLLKETGRGRVKERLNADLIPPFLRDDLETEALKRMIGYDYRNDSFTVSLFDGESIEAVTVQRAGGVKWKTYGAKSFIPYRIDERPFVYAVYGMKEILLMEAARLPFIGFQSDSIAKAIGRNAKGEAIKERAAGKAVILLLDNDESCKETVEPTHSHLCDSLVIPVDFQEMLFDQELPKGYDFFDFLKWCESLEVAGWMIQDYIEGIPPYDGIEDERRSA